MVLAGGHGRNSGCKLTRVAERHPEFSPEDLVDAVEGRRHDTDDRVRMPRHGDALADDGGICVEVAMPERCAENDLRRVVFAIDEAATQHHGKLRDLEEVAGDGLAKDALRLSAAANGCGKQIVVSRDAGEGIGLVANVFVNGIGKVVAALLAIVDRVQGEEIGGVADRRGAQTQSG